MEEVELLLNSLSFVQSSSFSFFLVAIAEKRWSFKIPDKDIYDYNSFLLSINFNKSPV